jgi:hypothetical protein
VISSGPGTTPMRSRPRPEIIRTMAAA